MSSVLDGLRKNLLKKYEKSDVNNGELPVVQIGVKTDRFTDTFSLGSPALDMMTYNAIPEGIFIEIYGEEASGKTTIAFKIAADFIRKQKKKFNEREAENAKILAEYEAKKAEYEAKGKVPPKAPEVTPYHIKHIMFVDAEGTANPKWALTSAGYDMNDEIVQTLYEGSAGQTAEEYFDDVKETTKSGEIGLVIFDSLVAIASQQVAGESMEKKMMGGISSALGDFVKRCTGIFNRFRTTFIGINGLYMDLSGYGNPERTPGGTYWKRACSLRLRVKKGMCYNEAGDEWSPTGKDAAKQADGNIIEVALLKTKFCRWDRKLGRTYLNYVKGFDILQDTIDVATIFNIIVQPSQGWYIVVDPETGEALTNKIQGKKNLKPYFEEHLDIWRKVYDKCYELLAVQDNPNTVSFEKMLGVDVGELFGIDLAKEVQEQTEIGE